MSDLWGFENLQQLQEPRRPLRENNLLGAISGVGSLVSRIMDRKAAREMALAKMQAEKEGRQQEIDAANERTRMQVGAENARAEALRGQQATFHAEDVALKRADDERRAKEEAVKNMMAPVDAIRSRYKDIGDQDEMTGPLGQLDSYANEAVASGDGTIQLPSPTTGDAPRFMNVPLRYGIEHVQSSLEPAVAAVNERLRQEKIQSEREKAKAYAEGQKAIASEKPVNRSSEINNARSKLVELRIARIEATKMPKFEGTARTRAAAEAKWAATSEKNIKYLDSAIEEVKAQLRDLGVE